MRDGIPNGSNSGGSLPDGNWRDLAATAGGFAFETDTEGRLIFVGPASPLGWHGPDLLGNPGADLLAEPRAGAFDPFRPGISAQHRRCWLRRQDGSIACLIMSVTPTTDAQGRPAGARGLGFELAGLDLAATADAAVRRRSDVLAHLLRGLRIELPPEQALHQVMASLTHALGAEGAAVVNAGLGVARPVVHEIGVPGEGALAVAIEHLTAKPFSPAGNEAQGASLVADQRPLLISPCPTRFGSETGIVLWRRVGAPRWDDIDRAVAAAAADLMRVLIEHVHVQAELAASARTDPLTGLANRRAFLGEVARRIERLDRDRQPGTIMLVNLEGFPAMVERHGHDVGDEALRIATGLLRVTFRPGDLVARLGGASFAVWMDGADEMTAGERAASLCEDGSEQFDHLSAGTPLTVAIGIAMRWPSGNEDIAELRRRAELALARMRGREGGGWLVWHEPGTKAAVNS